MMLRCRQRAFTLIELMVAIAVAAILVALAAPALRDFILMQRLKAINAQLVTDLQFARSEAAARNEYVRINFRIRSSGDAMMTCYSIYTSPLGNNTRCDCRLGVGQACAAPQREIRTVQFPNDGKVLVRPVVGQDTAIAFDHVSGGLFTAPADVDPSPAESFSIHAYIDDSRVLRTVLNRSGRPSVCAPSSASVGAPPCP